MEKIEFKNLPDTSTPINAENLNLLQTNVENAITKNYIQASLSKNITGLNNIAATRIEFDTFKSNGNLFETTTYGSIKIKLGVQSGRVKVHLHGSISGDGAAIENGYISIFQNETQICALNNSVHNGNSRNSSSIDLIVDYKAGDEFYATAGTSENTATLNGTYNRTLLIMEKL